MHILLIKIKKYLILVVVLIAINKHLHRHNIINSQYGLKIVLMLSLWEIK